MNDKLRIKGEIEIISYNPDGSIDGQWQYENLITNTGFLHLCKTIGGDKPGINRIGLGGGTTPANINDTSLNNKIILVNANRDYSFDKKVKFLGVVPENTFAETMTYTEGGLIFKDVSEEILVSRLVFPAVVYQKPSNSLSISYSISLQ